MFDCILRSRGEQLQSLRCICVDVTLPDVDFEAVGSMVPSLGKHCRNLKIVETRGRSTETPQRKRIVRWRISRLGLDSEEMQITSQSFVDSPYDEAMALYDFLDSDPRRLEDLELLR